MKKKNKKIIAIILLSIMVLTSTLMASCKPDDNNSNKDADQIQDNPENTDLPVENEENEIENNEENKEEEIIMDGYTNVTIGESKDGQILVTMETDKMVLELSSVLGWGDAKSSRGDYYINGITRLAVKNGDGNARDVITGKSILDNGAHTKEFTECKLIYDEENKKTVSTVTATWEGQRTKRDFTIEASSNILRIDYNAYFVNVWELIDWASGIGNPKKYSYAIYGSENWKRSITTFHEYAYYCTIVGDASAPENTVPDDPEPLSYKGYFIFGLYENATGLGYGRVVATENVSVFKLLWNNGMEFFPYFEKFLKNSNDRPPFTMYLFPVSGGYDEIIETGKNIVDSLVADK
jgi:hypothetical protein